MAEQNQPPWDEAFAPTEPATTIPSFVRFVRLAARVALGCGGVSFVVGFAFALVLFFPEATNARAWLSDENVFFGGMLLAGIEYLFVPCALIAAAFVLVESRSRAVREAAPPLAEEAIRHVRRSRKLALGGLGSALVLPALVVAVIAWSIVSPLVEQAQWRADFSARRPVLTKAVAYLGEHLPSNETTRPIEIVLPSAVRGASSSFAGRVYRAPDGTRSFFIPSRRTWEGQGNYGYAFSSASDSDQIDDGLRRIERLAPHWWIAIDGETYDAQQPTD